MPGKKELFRSRNDGLIDKTPPTKLPFWERRSRAHDFPALEFGCQYSLIRWSFDPSVFHISSFVLSVGSVEVDLPISVAARRRMLAQRGGLRPPTSCPFLVTEPTPSSCWPHPDFLSQERHPAVSDPPGLGLNPLSLEVYLATISSVFH